MVAFSLVVGPTQAQDEEFSFDFQEFSKSPWTLDGFLQGNLDYLALNRNSPFYRLAFLEEEKNSHLIQGGAELQMGLTFQEGPITFFGLGNLEQEYNGTDWDSSALLFEGRVSWKINPNVFVTGGKSLSRWGTGYAWNPPTSSAGTKTLRTPTWPSKATGWGKLTSSRASTALSEIWLLPVSSYQ